MKTTTNKSWLVRINIWLIMIAVIVFAVKLGVGFFKESLEYQREKVLDTLYSVHPINITPKEFLVKMESGTTVQQESFANSVIGKTVVWTLEVGQVDSMNERYAEISTPVGKNYSVGSLQTLISIKDALTTGVLTGKRNPLKENVGATLKLFLRDQGDKDLILKLNKEDLIKVRGRISKVLLESSAVVLDPVVFEDQKSVQYSGELKVPPLKTANAGGKKSENTYAYEESIKVQGKLSYEVNNDPERRFRYVAIKLDSPIEFRGSEDSEPEKNVYLMQLINQTRDKSRFESNVGKRVTIYGTAFHSHNAHHATKVLIDVKSVEILQ